jgi:phosphoglycerate dehydrogenase-like enzyme
MASLQTGQCDDGYAAALSKQRLFEDSDVLSLHLRLVPQIRES